MTGPRTPPDWPTADLVTHRVRTTPNRTAVVDADAGETWTYREFDRRVDAFATGLMSETDLERGSDARVGVLLHTSPAFASLCFAAMRVGVALVPLNVRETPIELESKVERTDPALLVCEPATADLAVELAAKTETDLPIRSLEPADGERRAEEHDERTRGSDGITLFPSVDPLFDPTTTTTREAPEPVTLDRSTTQFVLFTSGTSGDPKGVRLTVGNLVASATASAFRLGVSPSDRWLCCLPMYHMGGLAPVVRSALYGTAVVVQREFDPEATARAVAEHDVTGVSLVPTMLERLLEADWSPPESLRFVLLGGAPASEDLLERCDRAGVPAYPTYGMTETASQISTAPPAARTTAPGTVGQPLAFADVSIVDDGTPLGAGQRGEIVVDGPMVTPGYLEDARTDAAFGPHGLHTGDVGYRDENGSLWVVGRLDDRIVSGGENVDPSEVAAVLESSPTVRTAAVVGLPDEEWGERVAALLVPEDPSAPPTVEDLLERCADDLAGFKRPKTVAVAEEATLPRTPSGTVDREAVRELIERNGRDIS